MGQRNRDFGRKFLLSCQNSFNPVQQKNLWKRTTKIYTIVTIFGLSAKKKWKIGEEPSAVLSKLPISWSDGTFAGKTFFLNTTTFLSYSGFEQKLSDTYWNCFGRFVNTAFYVYRKVLRGRVFPREVYSFNIFRLWAKNNWNFTDEILQWRQNCILCNQGERFRKFFNFFSSFS